MSLRWATGSAAAVLATTPGGSARPDNVRWVNRRLVTVLVPLVVLATGCSTFSDNDAVARVNDDELSAEELRDLVTGVGAADTDAAAARDQIGGWVRDELTKYADSSVAPAAYADGVERSGSICVQVTVVDDDQTARDALAELENGAEFATVFADTNVDPTLADDTGRLGCVAAAQLAFDLGNPFVDSLRDLSETSPFTSAALPTVPGEPDLFVVSRFVPFDELSADETDAVAGNLTAQALGVDVHIDPRYGVFDQASSTVLPLG